MCDRVARTSCIPRTQHGRGDFVARDQPATSDDALPVSRVRVGLARPYNVHVGVGLLGQAGGLLQDDGVLPGGGYSLDHDAGTVNVVIVTNPTVAGLWVERLEQGVGCRSDSCRCVATIEDGEEHKNLATVSALYDKLVDSGMGRDGVVVALGGGVVGDVAGFVAATYMRGVRFVQVPTTLLAQVDASVGGKVAVDHPRGKNLIGAFHQPSAVLCDLATLRTLPEHIYREGLAEVIKTALISGETLFRYLEDNADAIMRRNIEVLGVIVRRCIEVKARIVERDEHDTGERMLLNLGHTFAHAIETACRYRNVSHGYAVAVGLSMASRLAVRLGVLSEAVAWRLARLLAKLGLPSQMAHLEAAVSPDAVICGFRSDKKKVAGRVRFVLPYAIGDVRVVSDVPMDSITGVIEDRHGDAQ